LKPYNDFGSWVAPFKGEIQNEPFGALKHIQSIAFLLFAYGWNTKWALRGIETFTLIICSFLCLEN